MWKLLWSYNVLVQVFIHTECLTLNFVSLYKIAKPTKAFDLLSKPILVSQLRSGSWKQLHSHCSWANVSLFPRFWCPLRPHGVAPFGGEVVELGCQCSPALAFSVLAVFPTYKVSQIHKCYPPLLHSLSDRSHYLLPPSWVNPCGYRGSASGCFWVWNEP